MFNKINLDYEHRFIIDLLLNNKTPEKKTLNSINFDKLIKLTSSNLIIPLTYYYLNHKNLIEQVDKEFANFIKEIYLINKERNKKLINQSKEIGELLKKIKLITFLSRVLHIF